MATTDQPLGDAPWDPAVARGSRRQRRRALRRARDVALGSERRIGLWILPLFLVTGLLGATLAGGLAVLYYAQQVAQLEETTAAARAQLDAVRSEVERTAAAAREDITSQVDAFESRLAADQPIASPNAAGVYGVSARHADGEVRVGSSFTVFSDRRETYFVTTFRLIETPDGFALPAAEVFLPGQQLTVAVHSFDAELDLAVLVARGGPLPVLPWRPPDEPVERGDPIYLAGVAGPGTPAVIEGRVGGVGSEALVPVLPVNAFLTGGPVLDGAGRVLAVASQSYAPYGRVAGDLRYAVPIRSICRALIRCTRSDLGAEGLGPAGPRPPVEEAAAPGEAAPPTPAPGTPAPADPSPGGTPGADPSPGAGNGTGGAPSNSPPPTQESPAAGSAGEGAG